MAKPSTLARERRCMPTRAVSLLPIFALVLLCVSSPPALAGPSLGIARDNRLAPVSRHQTPPATLTPAVRHGRAVDTSNPTWVVGDGQPSSCTSADVVKDVAAGGVVTFDCGPKPLTIKMTQPAVVRNTSRLVVLDGGGLITLSGMGKRQILFSDTCQGVWSTTDCVNQPYPQVVVQNITFANGSSSAQQSTKCTQNIPTCWYGGVDGGGAIYDEGGQFEAVNSNFVDNSCFSNGPDLGGGAIRVLAQYNNDPAYLENDTFTGNRCSNGGALSSISANWTISHSTFTNNSAVGWGANPAAPGTKGGGSGGAIYLDGVGDKLQINTTTMTGNAAREGGGAIFDVVDTGPGSFSMSNSNFTGNISGVFQTAPRIYYLLDGKHGTLSLSTTNDT